LRKVLELAEPGRHSRCYCADASCNVLGEVAVTGPEAGGESERKPCEAHSALAQHAEVGSYACFYGELCALDLAGFGLQRFAVGCAPADAQPADQPFTPSELGDFAARSAGAPQLAAWLALRSG